MEIYDLYNKRLDIIKNINLNKYNSKEELENIDFYILQNSQGFELLANLQTISESRSLLLHQSLNNEEKNFIYLKLFNSIKICENILRLKKNDLLFKNELIIKRWFKIQYFLEDIKENILFCGCKL
jgi:hypothetical protein